MITWKATTDYEVSAREKKHLEEVRKIAPEGMVLLENYGILPLDISLKKIALFGNGARRTIKGGKGSGDVNTRSITNIEKALIEAGGEIVSQKWLDEYDTIAQKSKAAYDKKIEEGMKENSMFAILETFNNPYHDPDPVLIDREMMPEADVAIYVLSRDSGEGRDRKVVAGDYELSENEKENIRLLSDRYDKLVIALNIGGAIDTKFFRTLRNKYALILISQAGSATGDAFADVLYGKAYPSGRLAMTWAENYSDYPSYDTYSSQNGNVDDEYYKEGIYVGYRYFDSFNVTPAYPFGYGKNYTDFSINVKDISLDKKVLKVSCTVRNEGKTYKGKEVVQLYVTAPDGKLEKPYQELKAFKKTKELDPLEECNLILEVSVGDFASYDEETASYILEKGKYYIRIGKNSRETIIAACLEVPENITTQKHENKFDKDENFNELSAKDVKSYSYDGEQLQKETAKVIIFEDNAVECIVTDYKNSEAIKTTTKTEVVTLEDVANNKASLDELVSQLSRQEMAELCVGVAREGLARDSVLGNASAACPGAAGDTSPMLSKERGIHNLVLADGPAGLRLSPYYAVNADNNLIPELGAGSILGAVKTEPDEAKLKKYNGEYTMHYQYCTAIPIATMLAQTWNIEAIETCGDIVGTEMEEMGVNLWLAPGMNIQKNPLCGRNFEYYSEDPYLSGMCAAYDTMGVQKHRGCGTTIKHFACNNQEDNRMHNNAHVSERALREIYLKGFEIAVKRAQPLSVMTSYNLINGVHSANNKQLLTDVLRSEWGFEGVVMTDWGTTGSIEMEPGKSFKYGSSDAAECVNAGNDLTMPGSQRDVDRIVEGASEDELRACVKRILKTVIRCRY